MTALEKLKQHKEQKQNGKSTKNIARIENNFIESFITKSSVIPLKILFFIARSKLRNDSLSKVRTITIDSKSLCDYCNISMKTLRNTVKNELMKTTITTINTINEIEHTVLIPRAKFQLNTTTIEIDIYHNILDMILEVEHRYTSIDTQNLMKLNNKHSIKMIQLLEQIDGFSNGVKKQKLYGLDELNLLFGTQYKSCYEYERRILQPIQKELDNVSKLSLEFDTVYEKKEKGRPKGTGFLIKLKNNKNRQATLNFD